MWTESLKALDTDRLIGLDPLIEYATQCDMLKDQYERHEIPVPEWLDSVSRKIGREIEMRKTDQMEARAKQIKAQLAGLATPQEKKRALQKELSALEKVGPSC